MKKIKHSYYAVLLLALSVVAPTVFALPVPATTPITFDNPITSTSLQCFISDVLRIVVNFGAVLSVFFIIYSGFLFVTASGNETKVTAAKKTFLYTIIGTAILLGAWVLATVVAGTIGSITKNKLDTFQTCSK